MSAQDNLSPQQFPRVPVQMTEPELVKYPKQLGALGQLRMAYGHVRTAGMSPMHAAQWAEGHGLDPRRIAYGKEPRVPTAGHGIVMREDLPRNVRNGW